MTTQPPNPADATSSESISPAVNSAATPKARLVKADQADVKPLYPVARLIKGAVLDAEDMKSQAKQLLQDAEKEAQRLVSEAKQQAQQELTDARQRGFDEGYAKFQQLNQQAEVQVTQLATKFSQEVTTAAFRLAREILDAELQQDPQRIIKVIESGLEHLRSRFPKRVSVHLHPEDFELVESNKTAFAGVVSEDVQFGFVKDTEVSRHHVIMETEMGHYDFSVESQLEELRKVIRS